MTTKYKKTEIKRHINTPLVDRHLSANVRAMSKKSSNIHIYKIKKTMTATVQVNGHQIEVFISSWTGKETIKYDGNIVSDRRNLKTFSSTHSFKVQEDGEEVVYEVQSFAGFSPGYAIRRNGIIQAHNP